MLVARANVGIVGASALPWEGEELTQTCDSRTSAVTSRQHSLLVWLALQEQQGKTFCELI